MDRLFSSKNKSSSAASGIRGNNEATEVGAAFPPLEVGLSENDLKEAAYEILLVSSGSVTTRTLTYTGIKKNTSINRPPEKSVTAAAASKLKKALGLRSRRDSSRNGAIQPIELVRIQLGISEKTDARLRRALSRTAAGQVGKRSETMVIPLELLQNIGSIDFVDNDEFLKWHKGQLDVLEAGLLCHPKVGLDPREILGQRFKKVLVEARQKPSETGRNSETMQALRSAVMSLAGRQAGSEDKNSELSHWADGYPLNVHLYERLLECCFDKTDPSAVIDEMDEVVELLKNSWAVLGMNQPIHNVTLLWVLFRQFFMTGQEELELLLAARRHMEAVKEDAKEERDPVYAQLLSSTLAAIQTCVEKRLFSYHDTFPEGAAGTMDKLIPSALSAAEILHEDIAQEFRRRRRAERVNVASTRIDAYIRSSAKSAFAQLMEQVDSKRKSSRAPEPPLVILAKDTMKLMLDEKTNYSPILRQWHANPAGVAAATLHACYHRELKQYLSGLKGLTSDSVQVCQAADNLEQELVQTVVEDGVDCEDGGKSLIREMPPFEGESAIAALSKKWVQTGLERLGEWAERNMTKEEWSPHVMREHYAPSVVDLLRLIEETLDAFYAFPTSPPRQVLQDLVAGIDRVLYRYVANAVSNYDTQAAQPRLPPLTRWNKDLQGRHSSLKWLKKDKRKGQVEPRNGVSVDTTELTQVCVRINTLYHLESELEAMEKKLKRGWQDTTVKKDGSMVEESSDISSRFERARASCKDGIQKLMEAGVNRAVFQHMRSVFWDGLYAGGVSNARIDTVIHQLDVQLEVIASTVLGRLRNELVTALMRTCFEAYLLVLLGGGPSRAFQVQDCALLEEDLGALKELFKADGDGIASDKVDKYSWTISQVLSLFATETSDLVEKLRAAEGGRLKPTLPPNPKAWGSGDANTILRVLCYRADETASKFLKKTYNLPKRI